MMVPMASMAEAGPAAFRLVRFWARRWIYGAPLQATGDARHIQAVHVVEVVGGVHEPAEMTIKLLAHRLGVDRSVASRMATEAEGQGYVARRPSTRDGRRVVLSLTGTGVDLLAEARAWQRDTLDRLLEGWEPADRERFAGYLVRLASEVEASAPGGAGEAPALSRSAASADR